mmetsp:Transcript_21016/g.43836  ORF Transcript_21016/g.43836 Transcript_21016/m.43836 type:complete len:120 (+) Transcript_21016:36-395(+)
MSIAPNKETMDEREKDEKWFDGKITTEEMTGIWCMCCPGCWSCYKATAPDDDNLKVDGYSLCYPFPICFPIPCKMDDNFRRQSRSNMFIDNSGNRYIYTTKNWVEGTYFPPYFEIKCCN